MTTPFIFDMTSKDSLMESMCRYFGLSEEQIEDFIIMNDDVSLDSFCEANEIMEDSLIRPDLYLASYHSTTNMDGCASIQMLGLLNLRETIRQDTPLAKYLIEHDVIFDLDNKTVRREGNVYDLRKNYSGIGDTSNEVRDFVAFKLYEDHQINGFLCTEDVLDYGGDVHLRPEFIMNVAKLFKDQRLESDWVRDPNRQAYVLKFIAPISDYSPITFAIHREFLAETSSEEIEEMKLHGLLTTALRALSSCIAWGMGPEDTISFLNEDASVPPQNIIQIYTADSYAAFNKTAW